MNGRSDVRPAGLDAGFVAVARVDEVPRGWVLEARVGGRQVAVANCEGRFYVIDSACPHAGGPLGDNRLKDGCLVVCPWHGAVFDVRDGEVRSGPARKPAKTYRVEVEDDLIYVALT